MVLYSKNIRRSRSEVAASDVWSDKTVNLLSVYCSVILEQGAAQGGF